MLDFNRFMGFGSDIKDPNELEDQLKELEYGLTAEGVGHWAHVVESWARTFCAGKEDDLQIVVKKIGTKIDLDVVAYTKEGRECVKQAIKTNLSQIPETTRALFYSLLSRLES